ncbi:MAG: proteophosphoglycan precursor [Rubritepida sp.]|nr:proteophosphoglycan precursor [Rubritepida sp.]
MGKMPLREKHDCGDIDMHIARDGTWLYKGSPITRKELVCLFASVLKREEDGSYLLETPVERGRITVEDAPFVAVEMVWRDCDCGDGGPIRQCLSFRTNCDEVVQCNADHPIRVQLDPRTREPRPYITVRPGLEAKINRAVFYEMVALAVTERVDGRHMMGVWSEGVFFPIDEISALDVAVE